MALTILTLFGALQAFISQALASPQFGLNQSGSTADGDSFDRDAPLQVLTDGTQDLAALVGLFATDSVERYAFDHTKGFLAPAVAPLSLLGLLGYVRALLKLSLGQESCEKAGFSIDALKSMMGVTQQAASDTQQAIPVFYLKRTVQEGHVYWNVVKHVLHDENSMPLIKACRYSIQEHFVVGPREYSISACFLPSVGRVPIIKSCVSLACLALSTFLSGFVILLFDTSPSWTNIYATAGLVVSVVLGAAPCSVAYTLECIPIGMSTFFKRSWLSRADEGLLEMLCHSSTEEKLDDYVAVFGLNSHYFVMRFRPLTSNALWLAKAISFCAAISIGVAYVCQYISLRTTTAKASGIWLAIQAVLAAIRVIVWIWAPTRIFMLNSRLLPLHRTLSPMLSFRAIGGQTNLTISRNNLDESQNSFYESFTELEYFLCIVSQIFADKSSLHEQYISEVHYRLPREQTRTYIPCWLADRMSSIRLKRALRAHIGLRDGTISAQKLEDIKNATHYFDMPCRAFAKWLELKGKWLETYSDFLEHQKSLQTRAFYTCRIVLDRNDSLHLLPGVRRVLSNNVPSERTGDFVVDYLTGYDRKEDNLLGFPSLEPVFGQQLLFDNYESIGSPKFTSQHGLDVIHKLKLMASRAFLPGQGFYNTEIKGMFSNMRSVIDLLYEQEGP